MKDEEGKESWEKFVILLYAHWPQVPALGGADEVAALRGPRSSRPNQVPEVNTVYSG